MSFFKKERFWKRMSQQKTFFEGEKIGMDLPGFHKKKKVSAWDLQKQKDFFDMIFVCKGKEILIYKIINSTNSPKKYLEAKFMHKSSNLS